MKKFLSLMVLVGILSIASPAPSSVAEALTLDNGHKYPSCAEIKADLNKKNKQIPFFLAQTTKEPIYEYGLLFRDFAAVLYKTGGLSCTEDTNECRKKQQEAKDIHKKYTEREIPVIFVKIKVPEGQKKRVGIIAKHNGKVSRRLCYDRADVCPVIGINDADTSARPAIYCISPDKSGTLSRDATKVEAANKKRIKEIQCASGGCATRSDSNLLTHTVKETEAVGVQLAKVEVKKTNTSFIKRSNTSSGGSSVFGGLLSGIGKILGQALGQQSQSQKQAVLPKKQSPKPSCRLFTATRLTIKSGESTTLQYGMAYSDFAIIAPGVGTVRPQGGTVVVSPRESTDYTYQAQNKYGYGTCPKVHITVLAGEDPKVGDEQTLISCSPSRVVPGSSAIILWQCPNNTYKSIGSSTEYEEFDTYGRAEGSARVVPSETSKFVVRCRDKDNREVGRNSCTITVGENLSGSDINSNRHVEARAELRVSRTNVNSGDIVTIEWEGYGTNNCTITGPDAFKEQGNKGSVTGRMLQTSTFELVCKVGNVVLPTKVITVQVN